MEGQIAFIDREEKKEDDVLKHLKKQAQKVEKLYEEFKQRTGQLYLYEKEDNSYHTFKQMVREEMFTIFNSIYQFSLENKELVEVEPPLFRFFLQFFNQFHTYTELITEEERQKIEEILFFELEYKEKQPYGYCLSKHQKATDILKRGHLLLKSLEEKQMEEEFATTLSFLYHILTYSTLRIREYKTEEVNVICEIGYRFLEEYVYPKQKQRKTPYLCQLEEMLNCHFKNYEPKWKVHLLVKESRNRYHKAMDEQTVNQLMLNKKSN